MNPNRPTNTTYLTYLTYLIYLIYLPYLTYLPYLPYLTYLTHASIHIHRHLPTPLDLSTSIDYHHLPHLVRQSLNPLQGFGAHLQVPQRHAPGRTEGARP